MEWISSQILIRKFQAQKERIQEIYQGSKMPMLETMHCNQIDSAIATVMDTAMEAEGDCTTLSDYREFRTNPDGMGCTLYEGYKCNRCEAFVRDKINFCPSCGRKIKENNYVD